MDVLLNALFLVVFGYAIFTFVQVLVQMKHAIILPVDDEEREDVRKHPYKPLDAPIYRQQKTGIVIHVTVFLLVFAVYITGLFYDFIDWPQYVMMLSILLVPRSYNLLNVFAVTKEGILSGSRFIPWKRIKSFEFVPIDMNHRYYGHDKKINNTYEIKIKMTVFSTSAVVISREMNEKCKHVLSEYVGK